MRPSALLFDCDGVVVDSEPITDRLIHHDLAAAGLHIPVEDIHKLFVGGTLFSVFEMARAKGADLPDDWVARFNENQNDVLAREVQAVPGIKAVLDQLDDAGIPYGMGSNGPMAKMKVTLGVTGLWDRFSPHIISAHDVAAPKPAPDVYLAAAASLGVDIRECVVVDDSISGVQGGQAAGARVIGFANGTSPDALAPYCQTVIDDMTALPALVGV